MNMSQGWAVSGFFSSSKGPEIGQCSTFSRLIPVILLGLYVRSFRLDIWL